MAIEVVKLSPVIGAEIRGVNLAEPLDAAALGAIHRAWLDHLVILFRGQSLDADQQTRFALSFGEVELVKSSRSQSDATPHVMFISNVRDAGLRTALEDGEMMFHSDQCYYEFPAKATTLFAIEVPKEGGNTLFANGYAAYETLPPAIRSRLEGRKALNIYDYGVNPTVKSAASSAEAPRFEHPVFRTHPETGRKAVYVNRLMTEKVVGLDGGECAYLLDRVFAHSEDLRFVYEHRWQPGDLLMWDNRCSMHARTDFPTSQRRMLRRVAIRGDRPF
ncbi:MAG: TauD/TfdA family dioxygenase [Alphaproteobacteria bacterium]|nr:TauD/TfdA family dioxygenase [Alphaproteobacteria bacterium]